MVAPVEIPTAPTIQVKPPPKVHLMLIRYVEEIWIEIMMEGLAKSLETL